jgi:hypothetical protein
MAGFFPPGRGAGVKKTPPKRGFGTLLFSPFGSPPWEGDFPKPR